MPVYQKTTGGEVYLRGIGARVSAGDRVDVDGDFAEYLEDRGDFRPVDVQDAEPRETDGADETDSTDESDGDSSGGDFDVEVWLDEPYQERADRVLEGEVDAHLETIADGETSTTVQDAIGERRAELDAET